MKHPARLLLALVVPVTVCTVLLLQQLHTAAFTFNQNRIIDDRVFDNKGSMSAAAIDNFLNQFPQSCISTNNHFLARDPTGYSPTGGFTYGSNVSAGQVIYDAAQAYDINPQVLIATLQKEQSLVDGTAGCSVLRYTGAVGYGCPDGGTSYNYSGLDLYTLNGTTVTSVSGTCVNTASKAGFTQQLIRGAWLLKFGEQRSEGNINWAIVRGSWDNSDDPQSCYSGPMTQGTWQRCPSGGYASYDGYTTIDSTAVHMDTGSTASLYWYTPHFHGNQSFFNLFTGWFGDTLVAGYAWTTTGYTITSLDGSIHYDPGQLLPGQTYLATLEALNVGSATWLNSSFHPVTLGTTLPSSQFCNTSWVACNRPAYLQEASVAPDQEGHFVFRFTAPYQLGTYRETFKPVAEFLTWFNDYHPYDSFGITVVSPGTYSWNMGGYSIMDANKTVGIDPGQLQPGQIYTAIVAATNTGTATWTNTWPRPVTLAAISGNSRFCYSSWVACNRPAYLQEASVAPGQIGHFEFRFVAPYQVGSYRENFKPVAEMYTWFNDVPYETFGVQVVSPGSFTWTTTGYDIYDQSNIKVDPGLLQANQQYRAVLSALNTGTATWKNTWPIPVNLAASNPISRTSLLCNNTWLACNRPATLTEGSVAPGQIGHFSFNFTAPSTPGSYRESFKPVAEMFTWFNDTPYDEFGIVVH